jgi:hypothetical protein
MLLRTFNHAIKDFQPTKSLLRFSTMNPTISLQFKQQLFFQAHSPLTSLLSSRFNPRLLYVDNLSSNMATIGTKFRV